MSRIKLIMDVKENAENLISSINLLLDDLSLDEEKQTNNETDVNEEKELSVEEVRQILADKSRAGFTEDIRNLLQKYGAKKLSEIDPFRYKSLVEDVEKLI